MSIEEISKQIDRHVYTLRKTIDNDLSQKALSDLAFYIGAYRAYAGSIKTSTNSEIKRLEDEIVRIERCRESQENDISQLKVELEIARSQTEKYKADCITAERNSDKFSDQVQDLKNKVLYLKNERDEYIAENVQLNARVRNILSFNGVLQESLERSGKRCATLCEEIRELKESSFY